MLPKSNNASNPQPVHLPLDVVIDVFGRCMSAKNTRATQHRHTKGNQEQDSDHKDLGALM